MRNLKSVEYNGNKLYSLKYDTMFKAVFGQKPTERLKVLLEDIIKEKINDYKDITILNNELVGINGEAKAVRLDLRVKLADGRQINIEMQNASRSDLKQRDMFYHSKMLIDQVNSGDSYKKLTGSICIWFLDYTLEENENLIDVAQFMFCKTQKVYHDYIKSYIIQLPRYNDSYGLEGIGKWMKLFNLNDTIEVDKLKEYDAVMKETIETIEGLSASDKLRYKLEAEEDAKRIYKTEIYDAKQEGEAIGIEKGEALGIEKGAKDIARKMKNSGLDTTFIIEMTGLSKEEINNIK